MWQPYGYQWSCATSVGEAQTIIRVKVFLIIEHIYIFGRRITWLNEQNGQHYMTAICPYVQPLSSTLPVCMYAREQGTCSTAIYEYHLTFCQTIPGVVKKVHILAKELMRTVFNIKIKQSNLRQMELVNGTKYSLKPCR